MRGGRRSKGEGKKVECGKAEGRRRTHEVKDAKDEEVKLEEA